MGRETLSLSRQPLLIAAMARARLAVSGGVGSRKRIVETKAAPMATAACSWLAAVATHGGTGGAMVSVSETEADAVKVLLERVSSTVLEGVADGSEAVPETVGDHVDVNDWEVESVSLSVCEREADSDRVVEEV